MTHIECTVGQYYYPVTTVTIICIMVPSPCNNVCEMGRGRCKTCGRTFEDIAVWGSLSEEEQLKRMEELREKHASTTESD